MDDALLCVYPIANSRSSPLNATATFEVGLVIMRPASMVSLAFPFASSTIGSSIDILVVSMNVVVPETVRFPSTVRSFATWTFPWTSRSSVGVSVPIPTFPDT